MDSKHCTFSPTDARRIAKVVREVERDAVPLVPYREGVPSFPGLQSPIVLVQATALTYEAGEAFTGYNLYPGKAVLWNVNTNTFTNYGDCYIRVIGGGTIQDTALQFIGRAIGVWSDDKIVFSVQIVSGGGGTVTVKESDGDPLLNAIDTLSFYAGQFVVTNPAANVAQINLHPTLADLSSYASLGLFLADKGYQDMHFHRHTYAGGVWHGTGVALRPLVFAYRAPSVPGGVGLDSGIMYLMPYFEARGGSLDRIAVQVQAFTCAEGSKARFGIYDTTSKINLYPKNLLVQSDGAIDVYAEAEAKIVAEITVTLKPGLYWVAVRFENDSGKIPNVLAYTQSPSNDHLNTNLGFWEDGDGLLTASITNPPLGYLAYNLGALAALPNPFPAADTTVYSRTIATPWAFVRYSG